MVLFNYVVLFRDAFAQLGTYLLQNDNELITKLQLILRFHNY